MSVCDETRYGNMSVDSWAFLHGERTTVSGCWCNGQSGCASKCEIQDGECDECTQERARRRRVLSGPGDPRLESAEFRHAYAIVPNNDLQNEICKHATARWARDHGQPILWTAAIDTMAPSNCFMNHDDDAKRARKVTWLQQHHQKAGGLYGMVPLVRGMPVHLTQHVDRSDKALLKQRVGTLVGWELHEEENAPPHDRDHRLQYQPTCVYVQFYDYDAQGNATPCKWVVGELAPGVYPVKVDRQDWYVNDDRQNRVARRQFPICPHFANTVYTAQGLTVHKGLLDLKVGAQTDATTLYVGMSRFRKADDLLILQPFDLDVLTQGAPAAPTFLLDHLQHTVDGRHEEAATKAEAYGERVRDEQRKKRTADRRRSENLSEENREAQRRRLVVGDDGLSPESASEQGEKAGS